MSFLPKRRADFIEPMDCAPVPHLPDGPQWLFEIKLDGYRAVAVKSDRGVNLFSRRRKSFDHHYPLIVEALGELPEGTVVDREVVSSGDAGACRVSNLSSQFHFLNKADYVLLALPIDGQESMKRIFHSRHYFVTASCQQPPALYLPRS